MIKTNIELAALALKVAMSFISLYVRGCFGAPLNDSNKQRYINAQEFNRKADRLPKIQAATGNTFGFDCVCFIKALLWGWLGDLLHEYGGATYQSNGVPDINADTMINRCKDISQDFSKILVGEMVWIPGHCGIYIGNCQVAECTYRWNDGVQITRVHNLVPDDGTPGRSWNLHGKLPWITYVEETVAEPQDKPLGVGDVVYFNASTVYNSEDAATGSMGKSGEAKITKIVPGAAHPIHLQRTGSVGPWGWVDESSIQKPAQEPDTPAEVTPALDALVLPSLRKGDKNEAVRAMQILLTGNGCKGKMVESGYGSFGGNTEAAVKLYQEKVGLPVTGVVDLKTWAKLLGVSV